MDADAQTKDLTDVDADLETILVSGLSYSSYAVVVTALAVTEADVADATTACGLSSYCSSVADLVVTEVETAADATTTAATKRYLPQKRRQGFESLSPFYYHIKLIANFCHPRIPKSPDLTIHPQYPLPCCFRCHCMLCHS